MKITFVLIPGLLSDSRVWRHLAQGLAGAAVYNADVRHDPIIEAMAAGILARVEGPLVAVGHSMGGRVAMEMARQAPDRVRGLVLSNTGHHSKAEGEDAKREAKIAAGHTDMEQMVAKWLPPMVAPERVTDTVLMADLTEMALGVGAEVHERQIRALIARPDAAAYLPGIRCPVLLLTGNRDGWSPEAQHREIERMVPNAELSVIDGAGHFLPVERPAETVRTILDWIGRHEEAFLEGNTRHAVS